MTIIKPLEVGRTAPLFCRKAETAARTTQKRVLQDIAKRIAAVISDEQLRGFCGWYCRHHGSAPVCQSVFVTCLCGYFHTFGKAAEAIASRCEDAGLIRIEDKVVIL